MLPHKVGNYTVIFRPGYEVVEAKTTRTMQRLLKHGRPKYLEEYINTHRKYQGYVYLIHFDKPYKHAKHYIGFSRDVSLRELRHRAGTGANLMRVITQEGIAWKIVRLWYADRHFERKLKKHSGTRYCPICNPKGSNA